MNNENLGGKLHQLLAVDGDLKGTYEKIINEAKETFGKRSSHFEGHEKTYQPMNADDLDLPANDIKHIVENVPSKLKYIQVPVVKHLDAVYQKESANTLAKANLVVEDENGTEITLAENVPSTVLLNLETKLKEIRGVYESTPTYDPAKRWKKLDGEDNLYISDEVKTVRTRKNEKALVLVAPTKEHPGQATKITVDENVGNWTTVHKSGALSPADKSKLLGRIDLLIRATKRARQKANDQEVQSLHIGNKIFGFIHG